MENQLAKLKAQIQEHEDALFRLKGQLQAERERLAHVNYGINLRTLIKDRDGKVFLVGRMQFMSSDDEKRPGLPWNIHGYLRKKDGTFSDQLRYIYTKDYDCKWDVVGQLEESQ